MIKKSITHHGHFISHGLKFEPHELQTIEFLLSHNYNIELIIPSSSPHVKRPDFFMNSISWETKSPTLSTIKSLERLFYRAAQQSPNIIFDLRRLRKISSPAIKHLQKLFNTSRRVKNFLIITKDEELIKLQK